MNDTRIELRMDFRSVNKFNIVVNALSGNFFPLTGKKENLSLGVTIYMILTWVIKIVFLISASIGAVNYVSPLRAFQECSVPSMVAIEIIIFSIYLHSRRGHLRNLIRMFNDLLVDSDDLKKCLNDTVEPHKRSLKIYTIVAVSSTIVWGMLPILKILETDRFTYDDYIVPAYLPGEPFTVNTFVCGVFLQVLGGCYLTFKKISIDIYISYFVTLLTAEYKYVRGQISVALRRERDSEKDEKSVNVALQKCVQQHCAVIKTGRMLVDLMAVHVGVTYINSILRFCFLGFSFISFGDDYYKKCIYLAYAAGTLIQVYMLCSCVQDLLEASTSITDDAFHEDWHGRRSNTRKMFSIIELSNQMECRLTAYRIVDLSMPTLASILNQAYSACLLLLRIE